MSHVNNPGRRAALRRLLIGASAAGALLGLAHTASAQGGTRPRNPNGTGGQRPSGPPPGGGTMPHDGTGPHGPGGQRPGGPPQGGTPPSGGRGGGRGPRR